MSKTVGLMDLILFFIDQFGLNLTNLKPETETIICAQTSSKTKICKLDQSGQNNTLPPENFPGLWKGQTADFSC